MVMDLNGQLRPVLIPEMPMFLTFNIALVRKGMDLSHMAEGLTDPENFDPDTGEWKTMAMDVEYVRVYQDDSQGETRGLNPPITYQTRRKLLANRVTCDLVPELRCLVKNSGGMRNEALLKQVACDKLVLEGVVDARGRTREALTLPPPSSVAAPSLSSHFIASL